MPRDTLVLVLALASLFACKKEDSPTPCLSSPAPRINLNSWPVGLNQDSAWVVPYDSLQLDILVVADGSYTGLSSGVPSEPNLTSVTLAIVATANDSKMYATSQNPNSFSASINTLATIGTVATSTPAQLRITTGNTCSSSNSVLRKLLITP
ncbi:MAG: hypothetical protein H6591_10485 [Flavobacteriales bacterium]|nr:hypothetical protein [Flavobacteriales bacterium]